MGRRAESRRLRLHANHAGRTSRIPAYRPGTPRRILAFPRSLRPRPRRATIGYALTPIISNHKRLRKTVPRVPRIDGLKRKCTTMGFEITIKRDGIEIARITRSVIPGALALDDFLQGIRASVIAAILNVEPDLPPRLVPTCGDCIEKMVWSKRLGRYICNHCG